jgi:acetyl esterase/lipase
MSEPVSLDEVQALRKPPADHRIAYGEDEFQFGELRLPSGEGPFPLVIYIHGGCWLAKFDLSHAAALGDALAEAGIAVWMPEYRRVGNPGGGWPGTLEDTISAVEHVRALAKAHPLDLERVVLMGHSAGGHLVLWYASKTNLPASSRFYSDTALPVKGVVALAPICDVATFRHDDPNDCNEAVAGLLGGEPEAIPARVAQANPAELLPLPIPARLIHGSVDEHVRLSQSIDFAERAHRLESDTELFVVDGAGHFDVIAPGTPAWTVVLGQTRALLEG